MTDGTVRIKQAAAGEGNPLDDRLVDNIVTTNDNGDTVYRQRVSVAGDLDATPVPVTLGQTLSTANTQTVTSSEASPGSPWVGDWEQTRDLDYVRVLTVLAATDAEIPGTFTFEFTDSADPNTDHPTLGTSEISESRPIEDFDEVRDFDLLNAGAYYRVAFEPDNALGAESVFITTTLRRQNDGAFVRLATQELEQANAAFGSTFAYRKEFDPFTGKSVNLRPSTRDADNSTTTPLAADAVYRGTWREWSALGYVAIVASVEADETGTLYVDLTNETSPTDGDDSSVQRSFTIAYGSSVVDTVVSRITPVQSRWVRVRYVNDSTAQATFTVESAFLTAAPPLVGQSLAVVPTTENLAGLVRSVGTGPNPDGTFENVSVTGTVADNSTTSTLSAAGTYTGTWHDTDGYASILVLVYSDQTSADGGVVVQQSNDGGTTVHMDNAFDYDVNSDGRTYQVPVSGTSFRVFYTNGSTDQTAFSLLTWLRKEPTQAAVVPTRQAVEAGTPGLVVRSVIEPAANIRIERTQIGTSATQFASPVLADRVSVSIKAHPSNNGIVYYNTTSGVSVTNGYPLAAGDSLDLELGEDADDIYLVGTHANDVAVVLEVAE